MATTPPTAASIRPLEPTDSLAELTDLLHRAYARLGAMGLNYTAVDQDEAATGRRASRGTCLVATLDGRLVGTVCVRRGDPRDTCAFYHRSDLAIVEQFAVDPALQGSGLGSRLLEAAEGLARAQGLRLAALDTAMPAVHLIRFYASRGWSVVDETQWPGKRYRSVVMTKPLGAPAPEGPA